MTTPTPNPPPSRHLALDNLRVAAMLLGLVVHGVLPFKATELAKYPIHDVRTHPAADALYFALHDFRMQVFFVLAGFAACALASRKGVAGLAYNRLRRIVLPLAVAVVFVAPLMRLLFARHTGAELNLLASVGPNYHLWFLYFLPLFCVPLAAWLVVGRYVPRVVTRLADGAFRRLLGRPAKAAILAALGVPLLWTMPDWWVSTPQGWRPDRVVLLYYFGFFAFGAMLYRHRDRLAGYGERWAALLVVANVVVLPPMLAMTVWGNGAEDAMGSRSPAWLVVWKAGAIFLGGFYTWLMVEGLVGLFQRHFAGERPWSRYLAEASYWCYLAGFPVQVALQVWLAHTPMPILVKFVLVNALTFAVLLTTYELAVRHSWVGLLLNGKRPVREVATPEPEPVVLAARMRVGVPEPTAARGRAVQPAAALAPVGAVRP